MAGGVDRRRVLECLPPLRRLQFASSRPPSRPVRIPPYLHLSPHTSPYLPTSHSITTSDFAVTSYEFGVAKPDPDLFLHAAKRATAACRLIHGADQVKRHKGTCISPHISLYLPSNLPVTPCISPNLRVPPSQEEISPDQVLHVGDNLDNDFLAAKAAGMRALLYDPAGEAAKSADGSVISPGEIVTSLAEVPAKIDEMMAS